jgi:hypothetical protein
MGMTTRIPQLTKPAVQQRLKGPTMKPDADQSEAPKSKPDVKDDLKSLFLTEAEKNWGRRVKPAIEKAANGIRGARLLLVGCGSGGPVYETSL